MKTNAQVIYCEDGIFPFKLEKDAGLFATYSHVSLLLCILPTIGEVELKYDEQYRVTIERIAKKNEEN